MKIKYITLSLITAFLLNSCAEPFVLETKWGQIRIDNDGKFNGVYFQKKPKVVEDHK
jgi:hypothetical protein